VKLASLRTPAAPGLAIGGLALFASAWLGAQCDSRRSKRDRKGCAIISLRRRLSDMSMRSHTTGRRLSALVSVHGVGSIGVMPSRSAAAWRLPGSSCGGAIAFVPFELASGRFAPSQEKNPARAWHCLLKPRRYCPVYSRTLDGAPSFAASEPFGGVTMFALLSECGRISW
jgi:hypothetical protein